MLISRRAFFGSLASTVLGVGFLIRDYFGGKKYTYKTDAVKNKLVIVTGATTGLGKATAKELAFRKAKVILACRDMEKCEKVRTQMAYACKNRRIECRELDLASQRSIRKFVEEFNERYSKLDILINNAGLLGGPRTITREGIEMQLGVNHMGHFLLTNLLLPKLKAAAPSRIITLTSIDYKKGTINKDDLNSVKNYDPIKAYRQSKLATVLFTLELAKRLEGTGVTVNAVYPGVVNTNLMRHTSYYKSYLSSLFLKPFIWMFIKNPKQGSQPVVYAAIEPEIEKESGVLFGHNFVKEELTIPEHEDKDIQQWLWRVSDKWTQLTPSLST